MCSLCCIYWFSYTFFVFSYSLFYFVLFYLILILSKVYFTLSIKVSFHGSKFLVFRLLFHKKNKFTPYTCMVCASICFFLGYPPTPPPRLQTEDKLPSHCFPGTLSEIFLDFLWQKGNFIEASGFCSWIDFSSPNLHRLRALSCPHNSTEIPHLSHVELITNQTVKSPPTHP